VQKRGTKISVKNRVTKRFPVATLTRTGAPKSYICNSISNPYYLFSAADPGSKPLAAYKERDIVAIYGEHSHLADADEQSENFDEAYEDGELEDETALMDKSTFSAPVPNIKQFLVLVPRMMRAPLPTHNSQPYWPLPSLLPTDTPYRLPCRDERVGGDCRGGPRVRCGGGGA